MSASDDREPRRRFGLLWALGLSILVHLLLVLLTLWFPVSSGPAQPVELDPPLTFRFSQPVEPTTEDPLEDAPFVPLDPPDAPVIPPPEEAAPQPELPVPPPPPPVEEQPPTEAIDEPPAAADLPERDAGPARNETSADTRAPASRQIDVSQALRDFQRMLQQQPAASPPSPPAERPRQHVIAPDLSQVPYSGFGVGNLVFESRDYDWSDYGRQVYNAIWRAWHRRLWASTDEFEKWAHRNGNWYLNHRTQVRFVINRNGQVTGIVQESGSGCGPLDDSAIDALTEVILPPLPAGFPRDQEVVHARFLATGPIREMRRSLSALRAAGFF